MAQSRLIELSYFDPHTSIRLTTYADTIVTDYSSPNRIISAVRFGGYPEVVKAMSDAIYGGATIDVCSNGETLHLDTVPKGYRRQRRHIRCGHAYGQRRPAIPGSAKGGRRRR